MTWVYLKTESNLWTVGFYTPNGEWQTESDWVSPADAANRVHFLNGGQEEKDQGPRYTVIDKEDLEKYVPSDIANKFGEIHAEICAHIEQGRVADGQEPYNSYIVVNSSKAYADDILRIVQENESASLTDRNSING